jgi:hypothetical protein
MNKIVHGMAFILPAPPLIPGLVSAADDSWCDGFAGASSGLCNAYCDSMHCQAHGNCDASTTASASE